jgi:hypothetical protein
LEKHSRLFKPKEYGKLSNKEKHNKLRNIEKQTWRKVLRLRGGSDDYPDYGDLSNRGWDGDTYNTTWDGNLSNTGWFGDSSSTGVYGGSGWPEDPYRYKEPYSYEDLDKYENPFDRRGKEPASRSDISFEAIERLRESLNNTSHWPSETSDDDKQWVSQQFQKWQSENEARDASRSHISDESMQWISQEFQKWQSPTPDEDTQWISQEFQKWQIETGGDQGGYDGGEDSGHRGAYDRYENSSDEDAAPTDLSAVRAAYPALDEKLLLIEEKLRSQGRTDLFEVIESVSKEERIVGFKDWATYAAGDEAKLMPNDVMELVEAQRVLQEYIDKPSVIVTIGQDVYPLDPSFDIVVKCKKSNGVPETLRQIEVSMPKGGSIKGGLELVSAITHAAEKIPLSVRDNPELLPPGTLEATIAVSWPPVRVFLGGDAERVYDIHGEYKGRSITDSSVSRGESGNLLQDTVNELNKKGGKYHNPVEFVERLNVIDQNGHALFELINTTPGVRSAKWIWRDLQG